MSQKQVMPKTGYVNVTGLENADKTASMGTVQPDSGRADRTAAARKPHQWKHSLTKVNGHCLYYTYI